MTTTSFGLVCSSAISFLDYVGPACCEPVSLRTRCYGVELLRLRITGVPPQTPSPSDPGILAVATALDHLGAPPEATLRGFVRAVSADIVVVGVPGAEDAHRYSSPR